MLVKVNTNHQHLGHSSSLKLQFQPLFKRLKCLLVILPIVAEQSYQWWTYHDTNCCFPLLDVTLVEKSSHRNDMPGYERTHWLGNIILSCANTQYGWWSHVCQAVPDNSFIAVVGKLVCYLCFKGKVQHQSSQNFFKTCEAFWTNIL